MKKKPKKPAKKAIAKRPTIQVAPKPQPAELKAHLSDEPMLEAIPIGEFRPTPHEEAVLSEPVKVEDIRIKPTKVGQIYLPHITYTRLFNRAFGVGGWWIRQAGMPRRQDGCILAPYYLFVHGIPVAFAWGDQEYHENNPEQSYGDAVEATVASALRRCAKRIGYGLELWDPDAIEEFRSEHCCRVKVKSGEKEATIWRLRRAKPFWNEIGRDGEPKRPQPQRPIVDSRPALPPAPDTTPINDIQARRFWEMSRRRGRSDVEVKAWLKRLGYAATSEIPRHVYDHLCAILIADGVLP